MLWSCTRLQKKSKSLRAQLGRWLDLPVRDFVHVARFRQQHANLGCWMKGKENSENRWASSLFLLKVSSVTLYVLFFAWIVFERKHGSIDRLSKWKKKAPRSEKAFSVPEQSEQWADPSQSKRPLPLLPMTPHLRPWLSTFWVIRQSEQPARNLYRSSRCLFFHRLLLVGLLRLFRFGLNRATAEWARNLDRAAAFSSSFSFWPGFELAEAWTEIRRKLKERDRGRESSRWQSVKNANSPLLPWPSPFLQTQS